MGETATVFLEEQQGQARSIGAKRRASSIDKPYLVGERSLWVSNLSWDQVAFGSRWLSFPKRCRLGRLLRRRGRFGLRRRRLGRRLRGNLSQRRRMRREMACSNDDRDCDAQTNNSENRPLGKLPPRRARKVATRLIGRGGLGG